MDDAERTAQLGQVILSAGTRPPGGTGKPPRLPARHRWALQWRQWRCQRREGHRYKPLPSHWVCVRCRRFEPR